MENSAVSKLTRGILIPNNGRGETTVELDTVSMRKLRQKSVVCTYPKGLNQWVHRRPAEQQTEPGIRERGGGLYITRLPAELAHPEDCLSLQIGTTKSGSGS